MVLFVRGGSQKSDHNEHTTDHEGKEYYFDFDKGATAISGTPFAEMPAEIKNQAMSLWNVALEVHTGRYYRFMFGPLYILFIPLAGFSMLFILISGLIVYLKKYRTNGKSRQQKETPLNN